jgi:hypothetical protein
MVIKKTFTLFFSFFLVLNLYSQEPLQQDNHPGYGWLLDSVFNYESNSYNREQTLWKITQRNSSDFRLKEEEFGYNFENQEYELNYLVDYDYPNEIDSNEYYEIWSYIHNQILTPEYRFYTHHEGNGYETTSNEYWNGEHWIVGRKERQYYNDNYNILHWQKYFRQSDTTEWQLESETRDEFNSDSTMVFSFLYIDRDDITDTISKSNRFMTEFKEPYLFKDYGKVDGNWILSRQDEYFYNENNQLIEVILYDVEDNILLNNDKSIYEYDEYGNRNSVKTYRWDEDEQFWETGRKYEYLFDENGNLLEYIFYWGHHDTTWRNDEKRIFQYDDQNREIFYEEFEATYLDSTWKNIKRISRSYEDSYVYKLNEKWDDNLNAYRDYEATESYFDERGRIIEYNVYFADNPPYELELTLKRNYTYSETENQYSIQVVGTNGVSSDTTYNRIEYYNKYATGIKEITKTEYQICPNPSNDYLYLESDFYNSNRVSYEIYSISGKLIYYGIKHDSETINTTKLPAGQYLLKVYKPNGKTETLKFQKM